MYEFKTSAQEDIASLPYNERYYVYSLNANRTREVTRPVIEKFMLILQESGISAADAYFIPGLLDKAITESNRLAQAGAAFRAYREECYDPRGYCEMFTESGEINVPYDSYGNPTKNVP